MTAMPTPINKDGLDQNLIFDIRPLSREQIQALRAADPRWNERIRINTPVGTGYKRLLREMTPDFSRFFGRFLSQDQLAVNNALVQEMIKTGSVNVLAYVPLNPFDPNAPPMPRFVPEYFRAFERWLEEAVGKSGNRFAKIFNSRLRLPEVRKLFFRVSTQAVNDFIRKEALDMAVRLSSGRTQVLREALRFIIDNNMSLSDAVVFMKSNMTITPTYAGWVKDTYENALAAGKPKSEALRLARAHSEKLKENRAGTQLRTELKRADEFGKHESMRQAIEQRIIEEDVRRLWVRTSLKDSWPSSKINDGTTAGMDELFPSGDPWEVEINGLCETQYLVLKN